MKKHLFLLFLLLIFYKNCFLFGMKNKIALIQELRHLPVNKIKNKITSLTENDKKELMIPLNSCCPKDANAWNLENQDLLSNLPQLMLNGIIDSNFDSAHIHNILSVRQGEMNYQKNLQHVKRLYNQEFTEGELSELTLNHLVIIKKIQIEFSSVGKSGLNSLTKLSDSLQIKLQQYCCNLYSQDKIPRITIYRRKKRTPYEFAQKILRHNLMMPLWITIAFSLYHSFIIKPIWDGIVGTPDPLILAHNAELQATNELIQSLQSSGTSAAKNLIKLPLSNPFKYSYTDYLNLIKPLLPISFFLPSTIAYYALKDPKAHIHKDLFSFILGLTISWPLFLGLVGCASSIMDYFSFTSTGPNGQVFLFWALIITASLLHTKNDIQQWKEKTIYFKENKTFKECLEKYLNDSSLEIEDFDLLLQSVRRFLI